MLGRSGWCGRVLPAAPAGHRASTATASESHREPDGGAGVPLLRAGRRTKDDIDAGGVLAGFAGVLVRDGYVGYDHIQSAVHAECGAHLLRALKGVHDGDPVGQVWAEYMANTLLIAKQMMRQT